MNRFSKTTKRTIKIPAVQGIKLKKNLDQATDQEIKQYQQEVGSLIYLIISTRPDIAYALGNCSRFMSNPSMDHFKALDQVWSFLKGSMNLGLFYKADSMKNIPAI